MTGAGAANDRLTPDEVDLLLCGVPAGTKPTPPYLLTMEQPRPGKMGVSRPGQRPLPYLISPLFSFATTRPGALPCIKFGGIRRELHPGSSRR